VTEARQENAPLVFGFVIAILLHLLVAVPALQASWGVGGASPLNSSLDGSSMSEQKLRERLAKALQEQLERAAQEQQNEVVPGMEKGSDEGMTWIGYEEYQQHLAAHGETDQAAFTEKDAGGGGAPQAGEQASGAQSPPPQPEPQPQAAPQPPQPVAQPQELQPQPAQQAQQQPPAQPTQPTPPVDAVSAASPRPTPQPSDTKGFEPQPAADNLPPTAPDGTDAILPPAVRRDDTQTNPSAELPPTAPKREDVLPEPVPRAETPPATALPQSSAPPATPQPPQAAAPQSPTTPAPQTPSQSPATSPAVAPVAGLPGSVGPGQSQGERSDRESDATSIADVPPSLWKNGKPLARKGLEIKTKKPALPILTQLTTRPGNPVCEILFGKDGVPVSCKVLMSSGYPDVDGPVLDALYRWRAKGSQLEKLAPGKTLTFRVRFILN